MLEPDAAQQPDGTAPGVYPTWQALPDGAGQRLRLLDAAGRPLSLAAVLAGWSRPDGTALRRLTTRTLAALPFEAAFWECPPLSRRTPKQTFECVVLDAPELVARHGAPPDRLSFERAFRIDDGTPYAAFDNLGGDARLIAPRPAAAANGVQVGHLLAFLRSAPPALADALWTRIAAEALRATRPDPLWISTSGLGVHWLHVRLDRAPKYYGHGPYRDPHWPHRD